MKILMLHNRYKIQGGEDVSTEAEVSLLKANGIDIHTMFLDNTNIDGRNRLKLAYNTIWSGKHYQEIFNKIQSEKYDIVHVQNFFPLFSPSIFYAAKKAGAKVVMSVRNYRLICPNGLMYVNDEVCTACVSKTIPYPALSKKCYRKSFSATAVSVAMLSIHNLLNTWKNKIDAFICISEFVKKQLILGNFGETKLHVKYNFVATELPPNFEPLDYYIYVGRISTEKGIDVLLDAFQTTKKKLLIIGDGPLKQSVIEASTKNENIVFLGKLSLTKTYKKIAGAKALVFPSKWHEPFGRTIVESFAHGTPVIGASLGGVTELIKDGYNGFLFDPNKKSDLATVITKFEEIADTRYLRENSYQSFQNNFTPQINYSRIIDIYNKVLSSK
jgi:glycosyltransferase involved in cell wall biosynthesis